jgi:large subunit ribosomal protein L18
VKFSLQSDGERKRLLLRKTNRYLIAQIVDDETGRTLCQATTFEKSFASEVKGSAKNREAARKLGEIIASRAKEKGITKVYFDRRGRLYHGKVAEFADRAREAGLEF